MNYATYYNNSNRNLHSYNDRSTMNIPLYSLFDFNQLNEYNMNIFNFYKEFSLIPINDTNLDS